MYSTVLNQHKCIHVYVTQGHLQYMYICSIEKVLSTLASIQALIIDQAHHNVKFTHSNYQVLFTGLSRNELKQTLT